MGKKLTQIQVRIDALLQQRQAVFVAIDGNCTAGKTTLAGLLAQRYDCNLLHMDDFFLRPEQRTPERYDQVGGNVDYERFWEEVLMPLKAGSPVCYRPFDCKKMVLAEPVSIEPRNLTIVEGSYSMHPYFGNPYDLKILLTVSPQLQRQRIQQRPAHLQEAFFTRWIPMEQQYLEAFSIADRCDLIL